MNKKKFKPHMMYGDGKSKKANTYEEHLALKKKGWGHSKLKMEKGGKPKGLWANIHAKRKRGETPAKPGDKDYPKTLNVKKALGGKIGNKTDWSNIVHGEYVMPYNQEYMDKEKGGLINGPSHDDGGVDIEVEGGEIVINKNKNNAAGKHEKDLLNLNNNPDDYIIVKKSNIKKNNNSYNWPSNDARKRGK